MKVVLLIGFRYFNLSVDLIDVEAICFASSNDVNSADESTKNMYLPGIAVDLYQAYLLIKRMNADRVLVITDINEDQKSITLLKAIVDGIVDANILTFIETIKRESHHYLYTNLTEFIQTLHQISFEADQLFIYYSGHARAGKLLLPNNDEKLDMLDFRDTILGSVRPHAQLVFIMDCCNSMGLNLPYKLTRGARQHYLSLVNTRLDAFISQKIIYLSATDGNENSVSTNTGSIFSRLLFNCLKSDMRSLVNIVKKISNEFKSGVIQINYQQTSTVYASYPHLLMLWSWLYRSDSVKVQLKSRYNVITIKRDNSLSQPIRNKENKVRSVCLVKSTTI